VRNLYALDSFNASQTDSDGRCPLHLAVEYQSSVEVIQFLSCTLATEARDIYGLTPLHIAVQQCKHKFKRLSMDSIEISSESTYMIHIINLLCDAYPALAVVEDKNEMSALEYAIIAEVDGKVIGTLQDKMKKVHCFNRKKNRSKVLSSQGQQLMRLI